MPVSILANVAVAFLVSIRVHVAIVLSVSRVVFGAVWPHGSIVSLVTIVGPVSLGFSVANVHGGSIRAAVAVVYRVSLL